MPFSWSNYVFAINNPDAGQYFGSTQNDLFIVSFNSPGFISGGIGSDTLYWNHNGAPAAGTFNGMKFDLLNGEVSILKPGETQVINFLSSIENVKATSYSDNIIGTNNANVIASSLGVDVIEALGGDDHILSGSDPDIVFGGSGNDIVKGQFGNDTLYGGSDNDTIFGGNNDDFISGDSGADIIIGGLGVDRMAGQAGADTFVFGENDTPDYFITGQSDIIDEFRVNEDQLFIPANLTFGGNSAYVEVGEYSVWQGANFVGVTWRTDTGFHDLRLNQAFGLSVEGVEDAISTNVLSTSGDTFELI